MLENLFVANTYRAILARIARTALAKAEIRLSTKATSFHCNQSQPQNPQVTISTTGLTTRNTETFDEVIVTAPLGWLKRNLATFHPPLPPRLTAAIANVSYGRLEKVYLGPNRVLAQSPCFTIFQSIPFTHLRPPPKSPSMDPRTGFPRLTPRISGASYSLILSQRALLCACHVSGFRVAARLEGAPLHALRVLSTLLLSLAQLQPCVSELPANQDPQYRLAA